MAVEDRNLVFLHQELDAARELGRDLARALDHLLRVDGDLAFNLEAIGFGMLDVAVDLGRAQQRLGRDTAPVQADAAELVALDDGGLEAQLGSADRRGIDRKSTRLNSRHSCAHSMQSSAGKTKNIFT